MINNRNLIVHDTAGSSYKVDLNKNIVADGKDPVLVKKDEAGEWKPVDKLDGPVHRDEVAQNYGLWQDREVTQSKGMLWWKTTDVVRPKDGKIDSDEIQSLSLQHTGPTNFREIGARGYFVGAEIAMSQTPQGNLFFLNSVSFNYSDRLINAQASAHDKASRIRSDDSQWLVK